MFWSWNLYNFLSIQSLGIFFSVLFFFFDSRQSEFSQDILFGNRDPIHEYVSPRKTNGAPSTRGQRSNPHVPTLETIESLSITSRDAESDEERFHWSRGKDDVMGRQNPVVLRPHPPHPPVRAPFRIPRVSLADTGRSSAIFQAVKE